MVNEGKWKTQKYEQGIKAILQNGSISSMLRRYNGTMGKWCNIREYKENK